VAACEAKRIRPHPERVKNAWRNSSSSSAVTLITTTSKLGRYFSGDRKTFQPWPVPVVANA